MKPDKTMQYKAVDLLLHGGSCLVSVIRGSSNK